MLDFFLPIILLQRGMLCGMRGWRPRWIQYGVQYGIHRGIRRGITFLNTMWNT